MFMHRLTSGEHPDLPRLARSAGFGRADASAVSGHGELHRTAVHLVRSPGAVHRPAAAGSGCLPGPVHRLLPRPHRIRPALLPDLVCRARPGPADCDPPAPGAVHPVDAGGPPIQTIHRLAALLCRGRVLQDLCHRRPAGAFTGPARPPALGPAGITNPGVHAPAIRGPAHRGPGISRAPATLLWSPCSACWACGFSRPPAPTSPTSAKNTATGCCASAARAPRSSWSRCRQRSGGLSTGRPAPGQAGRSSSTPAARDGPPRRHPAPAPPGRDCRGADRQAAPAHAPPHLRHHHARRRRGPA